MIRCLYFTLLNISTLKLFILFRYNIYNGGSRGPSGIPPPHPHATVCFPPNPRPTSLNSADNTAIESDKNIIQIRSGVSVTSKSPKTANENKESTLIEHVRFPQGTLMRYGADQADG